MTQVEEIISLIETIGKENVFNIDEIQEETNFPRSSIRRVLSNLTRDDTITRIEPGLFKVGEDIVEFHRKFIGTQKYRGNTRQFFAVTFEQNDEDREEELLDELDMFLNRTGYVDAAGNTGYADDSIPDSEVEFNIIYPVIEVGEL